MARSAWEAETQPPEPQTLLPRASGSHEMFWVLAQGHEWSGGRGRGMLTLRVKLYLCILEFSAFSFVSHLITTWAYGCTQGQMTSPPAAFLLVAFLPLCIRATCSQPESLSRILNARCILTRAPEADAPEHSLTFQDTLSLLPDSSV